MRVAAGLEGAPVRPCNNAPTPEAFREHTGAELAPATTSTLRLSRGQGAEGQGVYWLRSKSGRVPTPSEKPEKATMFDPSQYREE
jgi:hypothetical protein